MRKVRITADKVLGIIQGIFNDEDIDTVIDDPSAPQGWKDKKIQDILNVKYLVFKHRPVSTETIIAEEMKSGAQETDKLAAVNRGFCSVWVDEVERLFSKDVDMVVLSAVMEYWVQTNKIQLLEYLIEDCNIATSGLRIPVEFGDETRRAVIIFSQPNVTDIQSGTMCGEMAVCEISVSIILYPNAMSYSDYEVSFDFVNELGEMVQDVAVPLTSISFVNTMTQKAVPRMNRPSAVGSVNLSKACSFVLVFDGYDNEFINYIADKALASRQEDSQEGTDNNQAFIMKLKRGDNVYPHEVVIKDHQVIVSADTSNETHTLSLVTRGIGSNITPPEIIPPEVIPPEPPEPPEVEPPVEPPIVPPTGTHTVTFTSRNDGGGTVGGVTINPYGFGTQTFESGTVISIAAVPFDGASFVWFEIPLGGGQYEFLAANPATIEVNRDMTIRAVYSSSTSWA